MNLRQPFKPFVLTAPMHIGQDALVFKVTAINEALSTVSLTDPSTDDDEPLLIKKSDSDWVDWGDDFDMPQPLFDMMFGVEPRVGMIVVMFRPMPETN